jgi:glucose/mannose-6-phosphate isomerase
MSQPLDTLGIYAATESLPEQVAAAVAAASDIEGLPDPANITNVLVLGMGGSGIAGDFLTVTAGPFMPLPVVVIKGFQPPSYVNENTLVFAVSFSGDTAETVHAATLAEEAGAPIVAVTTGGMLGELAATWGAPVVPVDPTIPMPRAGLGALAIPPLVVLENMGYFPGASQWIALAVEQLRKRRLELTAESNPAAELARQLDRHVPIIWGGGGLGDCAARRWKTQINENAKTPAFSVAVPEACHNEIVGWGQQGDLTRQVFSMIQVRHDGEHPITMQAFDVLRDMLDEVVADIHEVEAQGEGPVAQLLDLMYFGDFVSLYLASQVGLDPGPIPVIDDLKARLAI